jgi:hypothetical protein
VSDLHEARDPEREPQIDTVGWLFLAVAVAITSKNPLRRETIRGAPRAIIKTVPQIAGS